MVRNNLLLVSLLVLFGFGLLERSGGGIPNEPSKQEGEVYEGFDKPSLRAERPAFSYLKTTPSDVWASESPLDRMYLASEGGGAAGTPGYLALPGDYSDEFYAESTPYWWVPSRIFDLRNTKVTFYLKEIKTISVTAGYQPRLFLADFVPGHGYASCILKEPVKVGKGEWTYNEIELKDDPSLWVDKLRPVGVVLQRVGFIGVVYHNLENSKGAQARGILGIDEFRYNVKSK